MPTFHPESLARWTGGHWTAVPAADLTGFAIDTRQLRAGEVFVALRTDKRDGHDFLAAAQTAGASAALVAQAVPGTGLPQLVVADPQRALQIIAREHRRDFPGKVIGITGSAGKTSTKNLLALLLGPATLATEANLNNTLGVPLTLTRIDPGYHHAAVIEAGISEPGEMATLAELIEPDVALVTLVSHAHTQQLEGLTGVANEKAMLPAATRAHGVAVFPRAVAEFPAFRSLNVRKIVVERADVLRPAEPPLDVVYFTITHRAHQTVIALTYGTPPPLHFTLTRVTDGMAQNAVLALCVALWIGTDRAELQTRLSRWAPAPLRGEVRREAGRLWYLDCYNANPASMVDALAAFGEIAPADLPRVYVLGGMEELGAEAARLHREVGQALRLRPDDHVYVLGAESGSLRSGALAAGAAPGQIEIVTSLEPVRTRLETFQGAVFVKGSRQHRLETVVPQAASPGNNPASAGFGEQPPPAARPAGRS